MKDEYYKDLLNKIMPILEQSLPGSVILVAVTAPPPEGQNGASVHFISNACEEHTLALVQSLADRIEEHGMGQMQPPPDDQPDGNDADL